MNQRVRLHLASVAECVTQAEATDLQWLSAHEQARLSCMTAARRRGQFLAGHWLLRQVLSAFTGAQDVWGVEANAKGAPVVPTHPGLHVSIAHSADQVVCAVSNAAIGVDVEAPVRVRDVHGLAAMVFSVLEVQAAASLAPMDAVQHFYRTWTLKEAWLKSRGEMLEIDRLSSIQTQDVPPRQANALVWQYPGVTVALVAAADVDVVCAGLPDAAPSYWQVGIRSSPAAA